MCSLNNVQELISEHAFSRLAYAVVYINPYGYTFNRDFFFFFFYLSKHLVQLIMKEEEDEGAAEEVGGVDSALNQLIEVKKKISEVNRQVCKLKKLASISKMAASSKPTDLKAKRQSSSEPSATDELLKGSKPSGPISEGASSLPNGVGEVKGEGELNFAAPTDEVKGHPSALHPDAAKSEGILNSVSSEKTNAQVKADGSGKTETENVDVNTHRNTIEVDPLNEDIPDGVEEEEEEGEDSVFIDGNDDQPSIPAQNAATTAPGTMMTEWEGFEEEAPVVPPSSKSYSSVASSPPTRSSFNRAPPTRQRQQPQLQQSLQHCPLRNFRASSLPPKNPSSTDKPAISSAQNSKYGQEQRYQRPPSPTVYSTRPQSSEFIPIPSPSGAGVSHPIEQEWPTLHASQQQPRRVHMYNTGASNQNASPPQWSTIGSASPPKLSDVVSKTPPTPSPASVLGSPPMPTGMLGSPPLPSMRSSSSGSGPSFSNPLLPTHTTAQSNLPPRFAKMQHAAATSQYTVPAQATAKRRPAGIGRGGRPLPPLDNSLLGGGVGGIGRGVPPVRPILIHGSSRGRPPIPPPLYVVQPRIPVVGIPASPPGTRRALLPSPLRPTMVMPPPVTSPIPASPEERWIYMSRRGRPRSKYDYPPLGSSAGLDII